MDTLTIASRKFRPAVVEALLAEVATLDEATVLERMMPAGCYTEPAFFDFEQKEVFARTWICVGRVEQVAEPGDCLATEVASEPVLVVRGEDGTIRALSAICQHRGEIIPCPEKGKALRCPLHLTYDFQGRLAGAPRMGDAEAVHRLRQTVRLPTPRLELWHGFIFVNLDPGGAAARPKPRQARAAVGGRGDRAESPAAGDERQAAAVELEGPGRELHRRLIRNTSTCTDFAPSVMEGDGVRFTEMKPGDNAIVRSVPMRTPDGGMMSDGWGPKPRFPPSPPCRPRSASASPSPCCRPASP